MAQFRRCLGIDIGTDSVKIAELVLPRGKDAKGVIVQNLCDAPLGIPLDSPEDIRRDAVIKTVRDLLKKNRIQTKQAVFSMPGKPYSFAKSAFREPLTSALSASLNSKRATRSPFPRTRPILNSRYSGRKTPMK